MRRIHTIPILLALLAACALDPVKLGEQPLEGDDDSSTTAETSDGSVTDDHSTSVGAPTGNGIGQPCDHGWAPGEVPESKLLTFPALDCDGLVCVYADIAEAPADACIDDVVCNATDPALGRFQCDLPAAQCQISPEWFAARSMCSTFCESDDECVQEGDSNCQTGFACAAIASLGEGGCRPACVCRDDLDEATTHDIEEDCASGTAPACAMNPGQGLCPG